MAIDSLCISMARFVCGRDSGTGSLDGGGRSECMARKACIWMDGQGTHQREQMRVEGTLGTFGIVMRSVRVCGRGRTWTDACPHCTFSVPQIVRVLRVFEARHIVRPPPSIDRIG